MRNQMIHIGCAGYYNKLWKGIFYPEDVPGRQWFDYYTKHFGTYEMNGTFYRYPTVKGLRAWHSKTPEGFLFCVKAPRHITHMKRFNDCREEISGFYKVCLEGLAEKLACVLFQLPPSFHYSQEKLQLVLSSLNPEFTNAVEFRHESWWRGDVYDALRAHNIIFCSVRYPNLPETIIKTTDTGYVRMHGVPRLFYSQYSDEEVQELYNAVTNANFEKAFIIFNNTASEAAIINAMTFKKYAGQP